MKLYKYTGTISEVSFRNRTACDIKRYEMNDRDKAPTRLEVFGALGKYILDIEGTDAEERYIPNVFYFDDETRYNLALCMRQQKKNNILCRSTSP